LIHLKAFSSIYPLQKLAVMFTLTAHFDGDWLIPFGFQHPIRKHHPKNWASGSKDCCVDRHLLRRRFRACKKMAPGTPRLLKRFSNFCQSSGKYAQTLSITGKLNVMSEQAGIWTYRGRVSYGTRFCVTSSGADMQMAPDTNSLTVVEDSFFYLFQNNPVEQLSNLAGLMLRARSETSKPYP
jgi:hypothetical protein